MDVGSYGHLSTQPVNDEEAPNQTCHSSDNCGAKKTCLVCGDKALGYNFNAITCESCKAFFRRNALKQKVFKCPFREQCEITVLSRRFCQKCRLRKCLEVGMLTDLIMTTRGGEQNGEGGVKIRKRRRHRESTNGNNRSYNCEIDRKSSYATTVAESYQCNAFTNLSDKYEVSPPIVPEYAHTYRQIDTDQWHHSGQFYSFQPMSAVPEYFDSKCRKSSMCGPPENALTEQNNNDVACGYNCDEWEPGTVAMSDIHIDTDTAALQPYHSGSSNSSNTGSCQENGHRHICALSDSMLMRTKIDGQYLNDLGDEWAPVIVTNFSTGISTFRLFRLEELLSANEIMAVPNRGPPISFADESLANHMGEVCVRRCVQLARRIQAFRNLLPMDQITLLKGAATELMALRGLWTYQPHVDSWRPIGFPHRYLRLECTKTYNRLRRFYSLFPKEWRTSDPIMLCLSSIILFDPNLPHLVDRKSVLDQQQFYYDLLKEFLKSVFSDSGKKYWHLCQLLTTLREKVLRLMPALRVELNPQDLEIISMTYNWRNHIVNSIDSSPLNDDSTPGVTICPLDD